MDLDILLLGSFEACMIHCVQHNKQKGAEQCAAVAFIADISYALDVLLAGGNCFLKNQPAQYDTLPGNFSLPEIHSVAKLLG